MPYKGLRDPEFRILVRQAHCSPYTSPPPMKERLIEIFIPRSPGSPYPWGTILVQPKQVCHMDRGPGHPDNDVWNVVSLNNYAAIHNVTRNQADHEPMDEEIMTPHQILGSILRYELRDVFPAFGQMPNDGVFQAYHASGLRIPEYMERAKSGLILPDGTLTSAYVTGSNP